MVLGNEKKMFFPFFLCHTVIGLSLIDAALTAGPNQGRSSNLGRTAACAATSVMQIALGQPVDYD